MSDSPEEDVGLGGTVTLECAACHHPVDVDVNCKITYTTRKGKEDDDAD